MKKLLLLLIFLPFFTYAQVIVTAVGCSCLSGLGDGGPASAAELKIPLGLTLDNSGNLYISDGGNNRIRKVSPGYSGIINTIAGNGTAGYSGDGGLGIYAQINGPIDVAIDRYGNVYIADQGNNCIRKVTLADTITTITGTGIAGYNGDGIPATAAQLNNPSGIAVDSIGNVYIADALNYRIRMVDTSGVIHTIAGTGVAGYSTDGSMADTAQIAAPWAIRMDNAGNIYYGDSARIRKIDLISGSIITTIAGNGIAGYSGDSGLAVEAEIGGAAIALDNAGNLFIADENANRVREVNAADGIINAVAGSGAYGLSGDGGPPLLAEFQLPDGIVVGDSGDIYISDQGNNRVRLITKHPLAISNIHSQIQDVSIYPNPCTGNFIVNITSSINEQSQIIITNILGEQVKEVTAYTNTPMTVQLNEPPGVYYISAISANGTTNKIIDVVK